jgi:tetratricopeptide (TPR) repeat protein
MRVRFLVVIMVVLGAAASASAQTPDYEAAKKHYMAGKAAQNKGDTDTAVKEYIKAYDITKDPSLFRQIGQAYEAAGRKEEAAIYYRRYLNDAKNAADRDDIKAKIAALEGTTGTGTTGTGTGTTGGDTMTGPIEDDLGPSDSGSDVTGSGDTGTGIGDGTGGTTQPPTFLDEPSRWQRTAAWISVGLGAVLLTTGAVLGTSALAREDDIQRLLVDNPTTGLPAVYTGSIREDYEDNKDEGERLSMYSMIAFIGGGVAIGAAVLFFVLDATAERPAPATATPTARRGWNLTPVVGADGAGVSLGWEF